MRVISKDFKIRRNNVLSSSSDYPEGSTNTRTILSFRAKKTRIVTLSNFNYSYNKLTSSINYMKILQNHLENADSEYQDLFQFMNESEKHLDELAGHVTLNFSDWFLKIINNKDKLNRILINHNFQELDEEIETAKSIQKQLKKIEAELIKESNNYQKILDLKKNYNDLVKYAIDPFFLKIKKIHKLEIRKFESKFNELSRIRNTFCRQIIQMFDGVVEEMLDNVPRQTYIFHLSCEINNKLKKLSNYQE